MGEKTVVVAACGIVPVSAVVLVFPSIMHIPALKREHYLYDTSPTIEISTKRKTLQKNARCVELSKGGDDT